MSVQQSQLIVITNANLFAPEYCGLKSLLIGGGKILAICDEPIELPTSLQVEYIDAMGQKVFPGYIDCHTHITGGGGEGGFKSQVPSLTLSQFTIAGVTTVVGLLGTDDTTRHTSNVVARAYGLRQEGISAYCWTGGYHFPLTTLTGNAKSDILYLDPVIGIGEFAISDHRSSQPTYDEFIRIASDTHVAGMLAGKSGVLHLHMGDGLRRLDLVKRAINESELPARVFHPTHINRNRALLEEGLAMMKNSGLHCDITAEPMPLPTESRAVAAVDAILLAVERGAPLENLTMSSDGGGSLPCFAEDGALVSMGVASSRSIHSTVMQAYRQGVDLSAVLSMATRNVAEYLKLKNKGRVREGFDADLVVVDDEGGIVHVMALGVWHVKEGMSVVRGTFEKP